MCIVSLNCIVLEARKVQEAPRLMKRRSALMMTLRSEQGGEEVTLPMRFGLLAEDAGGNDGVETSILHTGYV